MKQHSPGFLALAHDAKKHIREIDIEEYKRLRATGEAGQLVDVREDHEWEAAHAAGAIHLSKGVIERDIEKALGDAAITTHLEPIEDPASYDDVALPPRRPPSKPGAEP